MKNLYLMLCLTFLGHSSFAYFDVMMTGDILPENKRSILTQVQMPLDSNLQSNVIGSYDLPIDESSQIRGFVGLGQILHFGATYKWIPVPDYKQQPAMGLIATAHFAQPSASSELAFSVGGLFSKYFDTEDLGLINVYGAPRLTMQFFGGETNVPFQLVGGTTFNLEKFNNAKLYAELGLNLSNSFNYIGIGLAVNYDPDEGLCCKKSKKKAQSFN